MPLDRSHDKFYLIKVFEVILDIYNIFKVSFLPRLTLISYLGIFDILNSILFSIDTLFIKNNILHASGLIFY